MNNAPEGYQPPSISMTEVKMADVYNAVTDDLVRRLRQEPQFRLACIDGDWEEIEATIQFELGHCFDAVNEKLGIVDPHAD